MTSIRIAFAKILTSAKAAPRTGNQNRARVTNRLQRSAKRKMHFDIQRIQSVWPVQGNLDPLIHFLDNDHIAHLGLSFDVS